MVKEEIIFPPYVSRRSDRGLCVAGTGKTLYTIMDYIKAGWTPKLIRDWMELTDAQIDGVMEYIAANRKPFEEEYDKVVKEAEADREYWEEKNRERLTRIAEAGPPPGKEALWEIIRNRKIVLGMI